MTVLSPHSPSMPMLLLSDALVALFPAVSRAPSPDKLPWRLPPTTPSNIVAVFLPPISPLVSLRPGAREIANKLFCHVRPHFGLWPAPRPSHGAVLSPCLSLPTPTCRWSRRMSLGSGFRRHTALSTSCQAPTHVRACGMRHGGRRNTRRLASSRSGHHPLVGIHATQKWQNFRKPEGPATRGCE